MGDPVPPVLAFGPFCVDPQEQRLTRDGTPIPLTPKAFELLWFLAANAGRLLRKEELLAAVWPGTFVEEAVLSVNMSAIRKALGDDPAGQTYIQTVPRRGYRFVAAVERRSDGGLEASAASPAVPARWTVGRAAWIGLALLGVAAVGLGGMLGIGRVWLSGAAHLSVAVLPLHDASGDRSQAQFADAMTDLLVADLGRIPSLRVVSRQSTVQYQASRKPMPDIARDLNVDYVTEGRVSRDGARVRITIQLIHGRSDRQVWARSYEREIGETFAMQNEVADSIAREIGVELNRIPPPNRAEQRVPAPAYEAYLRGSYLADAGDVPGAIAELRKAIELYPDFAQAYARMASTYFDIGFFGFEAPNSAFPNMKQAALAAIEKDPGNAEAHAALAEEKLHYEWDWTGADREFRRSLELNPSDVFVRHLYAHYKLTVGQPGDSLEEMDRAFEVDPVGLATAT